MAWKVKYTAIWNCFEFSIFIARLSIQTRNVNSINCSIKCRINPYYILGYNLVYVHSLYWHMCISYYYIAGLDANGCPLGNSKFILLSDNLNICLWLSACQVEKFYQNQILIETDVDNPTSDLDVIYVFKQFNHNCFVHFLKIIFFCSRAFFATASLAVKSVPFSVRFQTTK